jgi:LmbE family N-acetylglucosaminyl deacetylase
MKENKIVLATGAHFDDVEAGIGGTIIKHINAGDEVYLAILESDEFRTGDPNVRKEEQKNVLKHLGLSNLRLITFKSTDDSNEIVSTLDMLKPDIIYTPYERDTHRAHRRCSKIAQAIGRKKFITTIFYWCGSTLDFIPNMFSIINFDKKIELLKCHKTQIECGALKLIMRGKMESYFASLVSENENAYAEGLIVRKMIYKV